MRRPVVLAASLLLILVAGCGDDRGRSEQSTGPSRTTVASSDRLPDGSAPFLPAIVPDRDLEAHVDVPTVEANDRCDPTDLVGVLPEWFHQTVGGGIYGEVELRTTSTEPCLVEGWPEAAIIEAGHEVLRSDPERRDAPKAIGVVRGSAPATVRVDWSPYACGPADGQQIALTFPGDDEPVTATVTTPDHPECRTEMVEGDDGIRSHLSTGPPNQGHQGAIEVPASPIRGLTVTLELPPSIHPGDVLRFVTTLTNETDVPVALDPCPPFVIDATPLGVPHAYRLNCAAISSIPAHGAERFQMELPTTVPDIDLTALHEINVWWRFVGPGLTWATDTDPPMKAEAGGTIPLS
jgi:hypothetical protein